MAPTSRYRVYPRRSAPVWRALGFGGRLFLAFAKLLLLQAVPSGGAAVALWSVLLGAGFCSLVALSRAGSTLFWRVGRSTLDSAELDRGRLAATLLLLACSLLLVACAKPLIDYTQATAAQLHDLAQYRAILAEGAR